jgi:hypothetical protein
MLQWGPKKGIKNNIWRSTNFEAPYYVTFPANLLLPLSPDIPLSSMFPKSEFTNFLLVGDQAKL